MLVFVVYRIIVFLGGKPLTPWTLVRFGGASRKQRGFTRRTESLYVNLSIIWYIFLNLLFFFRESGEIVVQPNTPITVVIFGYLLDRVFFSHNSIIRIETSGRICNLHGFSVLNVGIQYIQRSFWPTSITIFSNWYNCFRPIFKSHSCTRSPNGTDLGSFASKSEEGTGSSNKSMMTEPGSLAAHWSTRLIWIFIYRRFNMPEIEINCTKSLDSNSLPTLRLLCTMLWTKSGIANADRRRTRANGQRRYFISNFARYWL